jgi:hypothetical protein
MEEMLTQMLLMVLDQVEDLKALVEVREKIMVGAVVPMVEEVVAVLMLLTLVKVAAVKVAAVS